MVIHACSKPTSNQRRHWSRGASFKTATSIILHHFPHGFRGKGGKFPPIQSIPQYLRRRGSILVIILLDHVVLDKITYQHMQSDYICVTEYSHILTDFAWASYPLYLLISCMILRSLNEFIKFCKEIDLRPSCFVHLCPIHI